MFEEDVVAQSSIDDILARRTLKKPQSVTSCV